MDRTQHHTQKDACCIPVACRGAEFATSKHKLLIGTKFFISKKIQTRRLFLLILFGLVAVWAMME